MPAVLVIRADARQLPLADQSVDMALWSPPFFQQREYADGGVRMEGQLGLEDTPAAYIDALVDVAAEVARVTKPSGSIFVELGDKRCGYSGEKWGNGRSLYERSGDHASLGRGATRVPATGPKSAPTVYGIPNKSLMLLPERFRVACVDRLALCARQVLIWDRSGNGMPESVRDRFRYSHSDWVHLTLADRYFANINEVRVPSTGRAGHDRDNNWKARPDPAFIERPEGAHTGLGTYEPHPLGKLPGSVLPINLDPLQIPHYMVDDDRGWRLMNREPLWKYVEHRTNGGRDPVDIHVREVDHWASMALACPTLLIRAFTPEGICLECGTGRHLADGVPCVACGELRPAQSNRCPSCGDVRSWKEGRVARATVNTEWSSNGARAPKLPGAYKNESIVVGYACACWSSTTGTPAPPTRPAIVLDPFSGTGTTITAAAALGRHAIGVDRSWDYCRLSAWRSSDPAQLAKVRRRTNGDRQTALFA